MRSTDNIASIARMVVRIQNDVHILGGGLGNKLIQAVEFSLVKPLVQRGLQALPKERQAYHIHFFGFEIIHLTLSGIDVMLLVNAGDNRFAEFGTGQIDALEHYR